MGIISFSLIGIDEIGLQVRLHLAGRAVRAAPSLGPRKPVLLVAPQIEEPFGILPLESTGATIQRNVDAMVQRTAQGSTALAQLRGMGGPGISPLN